MDWLQFISSLVGSLAWPAAAVVALLVLRRPFGRLLEGPVSRMKAGPGGLELEWDRQLQEVRRELEEGGEEAGPSDHAQTPDEALSLASELQSLAAASPSTAVLESFARLEGELRGMLAGAGIPIEAPAGAQALASLAEKNGLITPETREAIEKLSLLRNLAAHGQAPIGIQQALDYASLSDQMLQIMRRAGGTAFSDVPGLVGLLDEQHNPLGNRRPCRFAWGVGPGSWSVQLLTDHEFDLLALEAAPSFIAVYSGTDAAERMFTLPIVGRPVTGAVLHVGPRV